VKIDVHHHISFDGAAAKALEAIRNLNIKVDEMNEKLTAAIQAAAAAVEPIRNKLDAIETFVRDSVPAITEAAVRDALAKVDIDEGEAATAIADIVAQVEKEVDDIILPAVEANTGGVNPGDGSGDGGATTQDSGTSTDTVGGGEGTDTVDSGTSSDTVDSGASTDTTPAGEGSDTVEGGEF
jgi:hypothetical protein